VAKHLYYTQVPALGPTDCSTTVFGVLPDRRASDKLAITYMRFLCLRFPPTLSPRVGGFFVGECRSAPGNHHRQFHQTQTEAMRLFLASREVGDQQPACEGAEVALRGACRGSHRPPRARKTPPPTQTKGIVALSLGVVVRPFLSGRTGVGVGRN
jgi:hypothetical protein